MNRLLIAILVLIACRGAYAGPGHDHGESAFAGGSGPATHFDLSDQQMANLGIESAKAGFLPISKTVDLLGFTELLPEKRTTIAPRFGGRILDIAVKVGQEVKRGERVATLEPVSVGNNNVALSAPMSGFVLHVHAGVGEVVESGVDILEIGDPSQMLVRGIAYETPDIVSIKVGQEVEVHLDIKPDRHITGKVQRINRVIDPQSRTFSVFALIDVPNGDIQPGLQGTMEIFVGNGIPVLAVPKKAVLGELGSHFVFVIKDKALEKRNVVIGARSSHHIEIKSGLFPHERVVTKGNYQLQYISVGGVQDHDHDGDEAHKGEAGNDTPEDLAPDSGDNHADDEHDEHDHSGHEH